MKIKVKNLGALKEAEFTLGDFTIICGGNNTGKTYATYALFGFLLTWRQMVSIEIPQAKIEELLSEGVTRIDTREYLKSSSKTILKACQAYSRQLPKIFAAPAKRFKETSFRISLDTVSDRYYGF